MTPLLRVVESEVSDPEAVDRMRPVVLPEPRAARRTLAVVKGVRDREGGYVQDRAYRILKAAINDAAPEPVRPDLALLYEREKNLAFVPLQDAFEELRNAVPALGEIGDRAAALRRGKDAEGARDAFRQIWRDADKLVGRRCAHPDPLVRSALARMVVAHYLTAAAGLYDADLKRPMWGPHNEGKRLFG